MSLLSPLSALFGAGVSIRNSLYDRGVLSSHQLKWPVVSVGNLRVGGTGKTPFVIHLGQLLQQKQVPFDVLSHGYGRASKGLRLVDDKGSARDFGDEPLLIAQKLQVPVIVCADRYAAGLHAEKIFANIRPAHGSQWLHILDDGFQHRRLARDFDIVLVTPSDAADSLLPSGRLREPLSSLRRADAIVLTEGTSTEGLPLEGKHVWRVSRGLEIGNQFLPEKAIAFCGIARPDRFFADLKAIGCAPVATHSFPDHHTYSDADITSLLRLREQYSASAFLITEKDAINLRAAGLFDRLQPIQVLPLRMQLIDAEHAVNTILGTIAERLGCRK